MATVTGLTADAMLAIKNESVVGGSIDSDGHLTLEQFDGTEIDAGSFPPADTSTSGVVELATVGETDAFTDASLAVTPAGLVHVNSRIAALEVNPVTVLASNAKVESDVATAYPLGISMMSLTTGSGWSLNSGFGAVVTHKETSGRLQQAFYTSAGGSQWLKMWQRTYDSTNGGGGWTAWSVITTVAQLTAASFLQTTAFTSYPQGESRLYYTAINSTNWDFVGSAGEIRTFVDGTDFAKQTYTQHVGGSTAASATWHRTANSASGWSKWEVQTTSDAMAMLPQRLASGSISISVTANTRTSGAITFPAGRFTAAPRVFISANSGTPDNVVGLTVNGITATGCTAWIYRSDTVVTSVYWLACQD
jgi:hypothetical protein